MLLAQELAYRARYLRRLAVKELEEQPKKGPLRISTMPSKRRSFTTRPRKSSRTLLRRRSPMACSRHDGLATASLSQRVNASPANIRIPSISRRRARS